MRDLETFVLDGHHGGWIPPKPSYAAATLPAVTSVWAAWIAKRHGITNRNEQFATASGVVASITSTVRTDPR